MPNALNKNVFDVRTLVGHLTRSNTFHLRKFLLKLLPSKCSGLTRSIRRLGKQCREMEVLHAEIKSIKEELKQVEKEGHTKRNCQPNNARPDGKKL